MRPVFPTASGAGRPSYRHGRFRKGEALEVFATNLRATSATTAGWADEHSVVVGTAECARLKKRKGRGEKNGGSTRRARGAVLQLEADQRSPC